MNMQAVLPRFMSKRFFVTDILINCVTKIYRALQFCGDTMLASSEWNTNIAARK